MYRGNTTRIQKQRQTVSQILVWGNNQNGLLSTSSNKLISTPQSITIPFNITEISASQKHVSFLNHYGQVYSFGSNLDGRLGIGNTYNYQYKTSIESPVRVSFPLSVKIVKIQCGFSHVCAIAQDQSVYAWGLGQYGALGTGQFRSKSSPGRVLVRDGVVDVSCGAMHTGLVMSNGQIYLCGSNQYGELGINKPQKISTPILLNFSQSIKQIACGVFYTLLLSQTGQVYGMGNNKYGQLGIGSRKNQFTPIMVQNLAGIVCISAGYHSAALDYYGNLFIWGSGSFGQLLRPRKFTTGVNLKQLSIRGFFGLAIGESKVFVWGNNTYGQLGNGSFEALKQPTQLKSLRGIKINTFASGVNFNFLVLGERNSFDYLKDRSRQKQRQRQRSRQKLDSYFLHQNQHQQQEELHKNHHFQSLNEQFQKEREIKEHIIRNKKPSLDHLQLSNTLKSDISRRSPRVFMQNSQIRNEDHYSSRGFKNYQELFNNLSLDYQELLRKYRSLEGQFTQRDHTNKSRSPIKKAQIEQSVVRVSEQVNIQLKVQMTQLNQQLAILRDELRVTLRKLAQTQIQRDSLKNQKQLRDNNFSNTIALTKAQNATSLTQLQSQFKHLLQKKDILIQNINQNHQRQCKQFQKIIKSLKQQVSFLHERNTSIQQKTKKQIQRIQLQKLQRSRNLQQQNLQQIQLKIGQIRELTKRLDTLSIQNNNLVIRIKQMAAQRQDLINKVSLKDKQFSQISKDKDQLMKMLNAAQGSKSQLIQQNKDNLLLIQHNKTLQSKLKIAQQQLKQFKAKNNYQKEFNRKYQQDIRALSDMKQKLQYQLNIQYQINKDQKNRNDQYQIQLDKYKNAKKQLNIKQVQLQDLTDSFQKYKRRMDDVTNGQDHIIKQLKKQLQQKTNDIQSIHNQKNQQIKVVMQKRRIIQRELISKQQQANSFKQKAKYQQQQINQLNQQYKALHRKYLSRGDQVDKQRQQKQTIFEELGNTKRQVTKYKLQKQQMSKLRDQQIQKTKQIQQKLNFVHQQLKQTRDQLKIAQDKISNLQKQNSLIKTQMVQVRNVYEQQQKINDQLSNANKQFADNQSQFTNRINQLQQKLYQLECQNKSYTPRYQALVQRNKQLDQRNKELSDMVNRAIQIQAQSYKNNILKEVKIDTNQIIQQVKKEQEFGPRSRRKRLIEVKQNDTPQLPNKLQEPVEEQLQPYSRLAKQRITQHKKRVSQSARKLAGILDMDSASHSRAKSTRRIGNNGNQRDLSYNLDDFQRINTKMENLQTQKDQFMNKINSFAQKLKIL